MGNGAPIFTRTPIRSLLPLSYNGCQISGDKRCRRDALPDTHYLRVGCGGTCSVWETPTFSRDVAPILFNDCVSCHRPGEMAPMSLLTYAQARPFARSIRQHVELGTMPPWHAEAPAGTFSNERQFTPLEKDILVRWASNGGPEGNPKICRRAPRFLRVGPSELPTPSSLWCNLTKSPPPVRSLPVRPRAHELHRRQVDSGYRDPAGRAERRPSRSRVCQRAGRPTLGSNRSFSSRTPHWPDRTSSARACGRLRGRAQIRRLVADR